MRLLPLILFAWTAYADESAIQNAAELVTRALTPQIRSIDHSVVVYNYFHTPTRENITAEMVRDSVRVDLFKTQMVNSVRYTAKILKQLKAPIEYRAGNNEKSTGLPGFYAALNPVSSAQYGGTQSDWGLFEITLRSLKYLELGTSLEDSSQYLTFRFDQEVKEALTTAGCSVQDAAMLMVSPSSQPCAAVVEIVLLNLKVDAILYPFDSGLQSICPNQPSSSLLFVSERSLNDATVVSLNAMSGTNMRTREAQQRLNTFADYAPKGSDHLQIMQARKWSDIAPLDRSSAIVWAKQNLLGCSGPPIDTSHFERSQAN